jgi:hypothetical protein
MKEDVTKRNPRKTGNGETLLGCSGRTALRREQCDVLLKAGILK